MYLENKYCHECCKPTQFYNGKCGNCEIIRAEKEHRDHFACLDCMTLEERIRRLEKIDYEYRINPPWCDKLY
jgi:hypothetical protein